MAAWLLYQRYKMRKVPELVCSESNRNMLEAIFPIAKEAYVPPVWCTDTRIQTIVGVMKKAITTLSYGRELIETSDGGVIGLDWLPKFAAQDNSASQTDIQPTVLILPGLTGSSAENYVIGLAHQVERLGYRCVVFNNRGQGGVPLKTARTYCAANTDDLTTVIKHLKKRYPESPIIAVGVSLGGLILTNYLAKTGHDSQLLAAMTISAPWNVFESAASLELPLNYLFFNRHLAGNLVQSVMKNGQVFQEVCDLAAVSQSRTIREFDESFVAHQFGYASANHYYEAATIHCKIPQIKTMLVALNAADDVFSPGYAIPTDSIRKSAHVAAIVTERGGHCAFLEGTVLVKSVSYMDRVFFQFVRGVVQHQDEITRINRISL